MRTEVQMTDSVMFEALSMACLALVTPDHSLTKRLIGGSME